MKTLHGKFPPVSRLLRNFSDRLTATACFVYHPAWIIFGFYLTILTYWLTHSSIYSSTYRSVVRQVDLLICWSMDRQTLTHSWGNFSIVILFFGTPYTSNFPTLNISRLRYEILTIIELENTRVSIWYIFEKVRFNEFPNTSFCERKNTIFTHVLVCLPVVRLLWFIIHCL